MKNKKLSDSINEEFDLEIQAAFKKLREDTDSEQNLFNSASEKDDLALLEDDVDLSTIFKKFSEDSYSDEGSDSREDLLPPVQQFIRQRAYLNPAVYQATLFNCVQLGSQAPEMSDETHGHTKSVKLSNIGEDEITSNPELNYSI